MSKGRDHLMKKTKELLGLDLKPISLLVVGHKKEGKNP